MYAHSVRELQAVCVHINGFSVCGQGIPAELARFFCTLVRVCLDLDLVLSFDVEADPSHHDDKAFPAVLDRILKELLELLHNLLSCRVGNHLDIRDAQRCEESLRLSERLVDEVSVPGMVDELWSLWAALVHEDDADRVGGVIGIDRPVDRAPVV